MNSKQIYSVHCVQLADFLMHSKSRRPPPPVPFFSLPPLHTLYSSFTFPFTPSLLFTLYEEGRPRHKSSMKWIDWFSLWTHTTFPYLVNPPYERTDERTTPPADLTALPHHFTPSLPLPQPHPFRLITVTGCTESSATRPHAPATGLAGTERPPSSSVSEDFCTTRRPTPVTGPRTLVDARSTVSLLYPYAWL